MESTQLLMAQHVGPTNCPCVCLWSGFNTASVTLHPRGQWQNMRQNYKIFHPYL